MSRTILNNYKLNFCQWNICTKKKLNADSRKKDMDGNDKLQSVIITSVDSEK